MLNILYCIEYFPLEICVKSNFNISIIHVVDFELHFLITYKISYLIRYNQNKKIAYYTLIYSNKYTINNNRNKGILKPTKIIFGFVILNKH